MTLPNRAPGRRKRKTLPSRAPRPGLVEGGGPATFIVAFSLAREAAAVLGVSGRERDTLVEAALAMGQWLADQGRPGRWDVLDPHAVLEAMSFASPEEATPFVFAMAALVGYAGLHERMPLGPTRRILSEVGELTANPAIKGFVGQMLAQLRLVERAMASEAS